MWEQYSEDEIKLPESPLPPLGVANISLNDQIFQGNHNFCPNGANYTVDCPSVERSTLTHAVGITPVRCQTLSCLVISVLPPNAGDRS
eukprot:COSAG02_NODE_15511_length_1164_cov_1.215962_2_plen_87_part_01